MDMSQILRTTRYWVIALVLLTISLTSGSSTSLNSRNVIKPNTGISCDFEEPCQWKWEQYRKPGFIITSGKDLAVSIREKHGEIDKIILNSGGPVVDSKNTVDGHFLFLVIEKPPNNGTGSMAKPRKEFHIESPWFSPSSESCYFESKFHGTLDDGHVQMLLTIKNLTSIVPLKKFGEKKYGWETLKQMIGAKKFPFRVTLVITPNSQLPSYIAIDDIRLVNCIPETNFDKPCNKTKFSCRNNLCIESHKLCDLTRDCEEGEDESDAICSQMPENSICTFEDGWCKWSITGNNVSSLNWERTNLPNTKDPPRGPLKDHTFQNDSSVAGHFLIVQMDKSGAAFKDKAYLRSPIFAKPPYFTQNTSSPYYGSCRIRFFYHMFGPHAGLLQAEIYELKPRKPARQVAFWIASGNKGNSWIQESKPLPKIDYKYYIQFVATRGIRYASDIALDDISLSPECFGLGVPASVLKGYNYPRLMAEIDSSVDIPLNSEEILKNVTKYEFTTCNNTGRMGPTIEQCEAAYIETSLNSSVTVMGDEGLEGIQVWRVPETKHYTLIAKGASGGRGALINQMTSHGSIVKATLLLRQGEYIYVLVGQEGNSFICPWNITTPEMAEICGQISNSSISRITKTRSLNSITTLLKWNNLRGGGGGGGGATFVFKMENSKPVPILIAGGGGGLAYNSSLSILPYGKGLNASLEPSAGSTQPWGPGGGGGWSGPLVQVRSPDKVKGLGTQQEDNSTKWVAAGSSLLDGGGIGGLTCNSNTTTSRNWGGNGGFGGGGGGCTAGGAGGGYVGGNSHVGVAKNGEGGVSFITKGALYTTVEEGGHIGQGGLVIIPAFKGCGCDYLCVLRDDYHISIQDTECVCKENWILTEDRKTCVERDGPIPTPYLVTLIFLGVVVCALIGLLCICIYNRYQRQKVAMLRRKVLGGPELQLSRLRAASGAGGVLTEYNPNYEFGGETYSLTDLKEIPRENLRLVKALGQGAFGEVYQGFYKHRAGDAVEMPVAVKTLPEMSSNQAEMDFLMEALIMSKFNHPNIVHFIGVSFDKHPRFIILELLAGGDLKTFLRESRPKPDRASPLTMKDLLLCALDIAKGCKYLEENHFIHRDIAARNCLLTSKGPGRVVKIADFGMARDIYRADYYKKGGKAMLPVKWMPPEAFLDGIFTSKTDVWSYGVCLWEVLSLGYMPYPGRGNQDVMQLVTNGGRLEPPTNCPAPVYGIMTQCWHPIPEERPNFTTLLERVGYCMQDPEVVNSPLPVFQRPPSSERDATLMRPTNSEDSCIRVVSGHRFSNATTMSLGSYGTEPTSPNSSTADYLVPLTPYNYSAQKEPVVSHSSKLPESQTSQTLLQDDSPERTAKGDVHIKRNGIERGVTLTPATLDKSKKPAPYANIGVKKVPEEDEEIRC